MGPNSIMAMGFLLCGLVLAAAWLIGRIIRMGTRTYRCERCGGDLTPDAHRYKGVVVWDCQDCGDTFETLNTGERR